MPAKELRENLTFLYEEVERPECDFVFVCNICIKIILDESLVEAHLKFCKRKENHAPTEYVIFITVVAVAVAIEVRLTRG